MLCFYSIFFQVKHSTDCLNKTEIKSSPTIPYIKTTLNFITLFCLLSAWVESKPNGMLIAQTELHWDFDSQKTSLLMKNICWTLSKQKPRAKNRHKPKTMKIQDGNSIVKKPPDPNSKNSLSCVACSSIGTVRIYNDINIINVRSSRRTKTLNSILVGTHG